MFAVLAILAIVAIHSCWQAARAGGGMLIWA